ncbi:hypothetical protein Ahy_A10g051049 [Arachis hypogaea]|uniref:Uncharacterized protein n=1 Tax=Arachis hypogaea TaxID=3818 RepID=A0A445BBE1_ARAHY|nr:hypothetical protein Ahy_A10g051049 [Arachis hypogaea]
MDDEIFLVQINRTHRFQGFWTKFLQGTEIGPNDFWSDGPISVYIYIYPTQTEHPTSSSSSPVLQISVVRLCFSLLLYYHGQILLQTSEGVKFVCENPLDIMILFTLSFEELKGVICEKIDSQISQRVSCILYKYPISVFGGFVQFQTKYVTEEASMQEMFSVYLETNRDIELEDYNSDSEEEFESNYEVVDPGVDEDQTDDAMVVDVANALANQQPFNDLSKYKICDIIAAELSVMTDGEFIVEIEFSSREAVIKVIKDYTIHRGVDYRVHESEPMIFYAKCTQYGTGCDWLIRGEQNYYWEIRRYNGSHTCTRATISQDHLKLDSNTIVEAIKSLVEVDPSIKVKSVIVKVQSKFNYTISYHKAWLAKQKIVESIFGGWEASYEALPIWFEAMCHKEPSAVVHFETMPAYQGDNLVPNIRSYYPCIRVFRHCKPIVHVDRTHLYEKYKGCLLVAASLDGNNNIVLIWTINLLTFDTSFPTQRSLQMCQACRSPTKLYGVTAETSSAPLSQTYLQTQRSQTIILCDHSSEDQELTPRPPASRHTHQPKNRMCESQGAISRSEH